MVRERKKYEGLLDKREKRRGKGGRIYGEM